MSEPNANGRKKLIVILIAAIAALALILGVCLYFVLGSDSQPDPTEPSGNGSNTFVPDPTDPTNLPANTLVHCICGSKTDSHLEGCDGTERIWTEWTATDSLPVISGYYYLSADVNLVPVADITTSESIYLDLNGHNINSPTRVYRMAIGETEVSLTVLDSVGGSVVTLTEHANAASFVLLGGTGNKTFTLYGGTIDGSALKADPTDKNGGVIRAATTPCTVNIHGGTVIGAATAKFGGTVYVEHGTLNMTGGEIKGGHALNGGNIFVKDANVTISGGKISGGVAEGAENSRGGNIFNNNSKITVSGSAEIFDGKATYLGSNVFCVPGSTIENTGKIYMTDGSDAGIYPVPDEPEDPNHMACICGSKTSSHLPGCDGTKYAWRPWKQGSTLPSTAGKYYLTSDVVISSTVSISTAADVYIDLNGKTITASNRAYLINPAKTDASLTMLDSVGGGKVVMTTYTEGASFAAIGNTGNKVLTIYGGTYDASAINANGNGAFVRVGSATSTMNIHGGTIIGAKDSNNGGAIHVNGGVLNMTGGEIKNGTAGNGGNIFLNGGSFTITGGKISGGTADGVEAKTNKLNGRGGNIFCNGATVKLSGSATICDGAVNFLGENIFYTSGSVIENKGNVYLTGSDYNGIYPIPAAEVDANHKTCICGSKTANHLPGCDGTVHAWSPWTTGTTLPSASGKYYLACDVVLEKGISITSSENIAIDLNGHTITVKDRAYTVNTNKTDVYLTFLDSVGTGKFIASGYTGNGALATLITSGNKVLTIYGGTYDVSSVETEKNGGLISAHSEDCSVNIHGGTIIGAKRAKQAGVVFVENGLLNITGGDISGGSADNGGNVFILNGTMTMSGGKIHGGNAIGVKQDGTPTGRGGNIFNNKSKITISGTAEIYDGTANQSGHNVFNVDGSEFTNNGKVYLTGNDLTTGIYPEIFEAPDEVYTGCICGSKTDKHLAGCDGTTHTWEIWTSTSTLPTESGKWILVKPVVLNAIQNISKDAEIYLDLNGQKVLLDTASNNAIRVYNMIQKDITASLTILDSAGGAEIDLGEFTAAGALVLINKAADSTGEKTFTLYGGTVNGSKVVCKDAKGVIIRNVNQTVNIHGGTIIGGETKAHDGGAIWSGNALNITGGEIYGGKANKGGNIYVDAGTFTLTGGKIHDGKATALGNNIYINDGVTFELGENAEVYMEGSELSGIYPDPNPPVYSTCICGSKTDAHLTGCDGTQITEWIAWESTTALPTESGYYYLSADVTLAGNQTVAGDAVIYLDLNGKTINRGTASRVYNLTITNGTSSVAILDSAGTGKILLSSEIMDSGALTLMNSGTKTFTLYGGTIDGTGAVCNGASGVIIRSASSGCTVNIHGGTIIGGTSAAKDGGMICSKGTLNMTGGEIYGGSAVNGGNIMIEEGSFTLTGGKIHDGTASGMGSNIYIKEGATFELGEDAEVYMEGSELTGIYPDPNPPVYSSCICGSKTDVHLTGCDGTQITEWVAWESTTSLPTTDGYWYLTADVTLTERQVITEAGANIYVDLSGKKVTLGNNSIRVYNMISNNSYNLTILDSVGGAVIDLAETTDAGALVIMNKDTKTFTMYGGTVIGTGATCNGSDGVIIRNINQTVNIHGGTILGGTSAAKDGGAIYSGGTLNITGGEIKGGSATKGGNIMIGDGSFTMTGGTVLDGTAKSNGSNIYIAAAAQENYTIAENAVVGFTDPEKADITGIYPLEVAATYTVAHKKQNLDNEEFGEEVVVQTLSGMPGSLTQAAILTDGTMDGFTPMAFEQVTINADGTTIVEILYTRNTYTLTWICEGQTHATEQLKFGAAITAPADPAKVDYIFTGWDPAAPATMPAEDLVLTAQFVYSKNYTVSFDSNGGSDVAEQIVPENGVATKPADPAKLYSTFAGWYTDEALTNAWSFETPVTADTVLYAKWTSSVEWTEWTSQTELPTASGYYKLTAPVTVTSTINLTDAAEIVLDLNGQTVTANITEGTKSVYLLNSTGNLTLSIWDSAEGGKFELNANYFAEIKNTGTNILNIQGGTINGGNYSADNGGVFKINGTKNEINVSGGTVKGANVGSKNGGVALIGNGGTFRVTGGAVYGGHAKNGGNFMVQQNGKLIISGGEVYGGTADDRGGNIFCNAIVVIDGGAVRDGVSNSTDAEKSRSGNIWVVANQKLLSSLEPQVAYDVTGFAYVYNTTDGVLDEALGNGIVKK